MTQSAGHVKSFLSMPRLELASYLGCLNLHDKLARKAPGSGRLGGRGGIRGMSQFIPEVSCSPPAGRRARRPRCPPGASTAGPVSEVPAGTGFTHWDS